MSMPRVTITSFACGASGSRVVPVRVVLVGQPPIWMPFGVKKVTRRLGTAVAARARRGASDAKAGKAMAIPPRPRSTDLRRTVLGSIIGTLLLDERSDGSERHR